MLVETSELLPRLSELGGLLCNIPTKYAVVLLAWQYPEIWRFCMAVWFNSYKVEQIWWIGCLKRFSWRAGQLLCWRVSCMVVNYCAFRQKSESSYSKKSPKLHPRHYSGKIHHHYVLLSVSCRCQKDGRYGPGLKGVVCF